LPYRGSRSWSLESVYPGGIGGAAFTARLAAAQRGEADEEIADLVAFAGLWHERYGAAPGVAAASALSRVPVTELMDCARSHRRLVSGLSEPRQVRAHLSEAAALLDRVLAARAPVKAALAREEQILARCLEVCRGAREVLWRYLARRGEFSWLDGPPPDAPPRRWSWSLAQQLVVSAVTRFDPQMARVLRQALARGWIDASTPPGAGRSLCCGLPSVGEFRALVRFDGSLPTVLALAHELGHGHGFLLRRAVGAGPPRPAQVEVPSLLVEGLTRRELERRTSDQPGLLLRAAARYLLEMPAALELEQALLARGPGWTTAELCELTAEVRRRWMGPTLTDPFAEGWALQPQLFGPVAESTILPYVLGFLLEQQIGADPQRAPAVAEILVTEQPLEDACLSALGCSSTGDGDALARALEQALAAYPVNTRVNRARSAAPADPA